ncbi:uncharacterized protein [Drosophila bipectinata]|uniref:uncharacterized protein n=1 Tax=Drosophila bipectinata TaxID=42026 RepID=UPI0038B244B8
MATPSQQELQTKLAMLGWTIHHEAGDNVSQNLDEQATPLRQLASAALLITGDAVDPAYQTGIPVKPADQSGFQGQKVVEQNQGLCGSHNGPTGPTFNARQSRKRSH